MKATRADTADPDDLAGHVDHLEPLQQMATVVLQRGAVGAELLVDDLLELVGRHAGGVGELSRGDHDRRLTDDAVLAVDEFCQLGQRLQAVVRARLQRPSCELPSRLLTSFLRFSSFMDRAMILMFAISSCSERWAYQTSMVPISANSSIASR